MIPVMNSGLVDEGCTPHNSALALKNNNAAYAQRRKGKGYARPIEAAPNHSNSDIFSHHLLPSRRAKGTKIY